MVATVARRERGRLDLISTFDELEALRRLDIDAYGELALDAATFRAWWEAYDLGLRVIRTEGGQVLAAIGVWPISEQTCRQLIAGDICEHQIFPLSSEEVEGKPAKFWYCSGLLTLERSTLNPPMKRLINSMEDSLYRSPHSSYPIRLLAIGSTDQGVSMLNRFHFELVKPGEELPDGCPLYSREFRDASGVRGMLLR